MNHLWGRVYNIMNPENNQNSMNFKQKLEKFKKSELYKELAKRIKSFAWRALMLFVAGLLGIIADGIAGHPAEIGTLEVVLGLALGEVSKYLNKKYGNLGDF